MINMRAMMVCGAEQEPIADNGQHKTIRVESTLRPTENIDRPTLFFQNEAGTG